MNGGPPEGPYRIHDLALQRLQNFDNGLTSEEIRKMVRHISNDTHVANTYLNLENQDLRVYFVRDTINPEEYSL